MVSLAPSQFFKGPKRSSDPGLQIVQHPAKIVVNWQTSVKNCVKTLLTCVHLSVFALQSGKNVCGTHQGMAHCCGVASVLILVVTF